MQNKLFVIGIGPGEFHKMTLEAIDILKQCECIVGYGVYTALLKPHFPDKQYLETPMKQETARVSLALEQAAKGIITAIVSSGDSGVYGMAGLALEMAKELNVEVIIIPGVTAVLSGGAVLGAPIGHDFAVISLSDLLTPWGLIEKRLKMAAAGDFCICLYNPSSIKRKDYLQKACDIMLKEQSEKIVCGIVKNIARLGQCSEILTLQKLRDKETDMFTTVFIGNSQTKIIGGRMVTPRGYENG